MIEDKELRDLFKAESAEHIQNIDSLILRLEAKPADRAAFEEVFREAHSIKGSARMLGVREVELIAGRVEDLLGVLKKGDTGLTPDLTDRLYEGLEVIKKLVHEAVTGEPCGVDVTAAINRLGAGLLQGETQPQEGAASGAEEGPVAPERAEQGATSSGARKHSGYRIDTVRVETKRLDELMAHAGELTVMKTRLAHLVTLIEEAMEIWEQVEKNSYSGFSAAVQVKRGEGVREIPGLRSRDILSGLGTALGNLRDEIYTDSSRLEYIANELDDGIRNIRLLPFSTILNLFPRMVRDMAKGCSREVTLEMEGAGTRADKRIIEEMKDPLMHIIRNAIDHGIELPGERELAGKPRGGKVMVSVRKTDANIIIEVSDDGRGLDVEAIKRMAAKRRMYSESELAAMTTAEVQSLIFSSGFSTSEFLTDISGRGVGLDVVRANVELLKGTAEAQSVPGAGCTIRVKLPVTLATTRVIIATVNGRNYAIPFEFVHATRLVGKDEVQSIKGKETAVINGEAVPVARLSDVLELADSSKKQRTPGAAPVPCVIFSVGAEKFGALADALLDEQEVVLKPQGSLLKRVRNVSGATILGNGEVCMVLDPLDMMKTLLKRPTGVQAGSREAKEEKKFSILLVEDSITTRTQEKRILEGAGYEVVTAIDGLDALGKLSARRFDAVVSDILMPNMDGLTLAARIREDRRYKDLPVILVTTLASDEDKKRGLEAGANAYIPKPAFDQKILLETLSRLI